MTTAEEQAAWVLRRVGFGPTSPDLDRMATMGIADLLDELFEPDRMAVPDDGDPWDGTELAEVAENPGDFIDPVASWLDRMHAASRPVDEWLAWFWHGHLVSSGRVVRSPRGLVDQIRLYRSLGDGDVETLLRETTINPAMLRYLDGDRSTGRSPNENYSRELLELFALGIGNYTEVDVAAGAAALTGWTQDRANSTARFVPRRHDDTPRTYLGQTGVHDLDTVIAAVVAHPACARHITAALAAVVLGPGVPAETIDAEAARFADDGMVVRPLLRRLVERGVAGESTPAVLAPVPWLVGVVRATGAELPLEQVARILEGSGQLPLFPPSVAGWPGGPAWFSTSTTAARFDGAQIVAATADPNGRAVAAADDRDLAALARALGRPDGFAPATFDALRASGEGGRTLLALSLATPDLVIA